MARTDSTTLSDSGAASAGDVLLVVGDGRVLTVELGDRELVIGRGEGCDVALEHRALSRRHAVLAPGPPAMVRDLDSHNGTRVGSELHRGGEPIALATGEAFHIGPFSFVVVRRGSRDRSASYGDLLRVSDPTPAGVSPLVRDIAKSQVNVLIVGETGVGKEVLATTIHGLSGRKGALAGLNCAALNDNLLESELFGHEKGSFTGATSQKIGLLEAAAGGTVFLDEVGELSPAIQAKLLRAVEHREAQRIGSTRPLKLDVRFIAATNRDLLAEVEAGTFRRDLFFRLDGVQLLIPSLRERRALIAPLAARFLADTRPGLRISSAAIAALEAHAWPGNVRELKAVIERAALLAQGGDVTPRHLAFSKLVEPAAAAPAASRPADPTGDLTDAQRAERDRILRALEDCAGNQTRAAKSLGMSRSTLLIKLQVYRIPRPRV
jgi:two-component system, NtrC family, response regulator AtoC